MTTEFIKLLTALLMTVVTARVTGQSQIDIVYPKENQVVVAVDSTFIFGSVGGPNTLLLVNGLRVPVYSNGTFLAYVPVTLGDFVFDCVAVTASDTSRVERRVVIPGWSIPHNDSAVVIDTTFLLPDRDLELGPGDIINFSFRGSPGMQAQYSISGLIATGEMLEDSTQRDAYWGESVFGEGEETYLSAPQGVYRGSYRIPAGAHVDAARIVFSLTAESGATTSAIAPGEITVRDAQDITIAELTAGSTVARTGPGLGYHMFLPSGVKLVVDGQNGDYYRARLSDQEEAWVPASNVAFLPPGAAVPYSHVQVVRTDDRGDRVAVRIYLQEKLPFRIEQTALPSALSITIFGADADTDWIRNDYMDSMIEEVSWSQPGRKTYRLQVRLKHQQQWGYSAYYEGNVLVVAIKKPPVKFSLKGLVVCLDPGHGPDDGAVGPTRVTEKDANLGLAMVLKERFEKKGARVFLTRKESYGATLGVRTQMARYIGADLFLSLHHNALPDGVNPFKSRGTSTYYYQPQSRPLAAAVQGQMLKKLKLPDFGLYYDNLAVCRITEMPSILIEPAFIMHPEEEMLIAASDFKDRVAESIVKGVEQFLKEVKGK